MQITNALFECNLILDACSIVRFIERNIITFLDASAQSWRQKRGNECPKFRRTDGRAGISDDNPTDYGDDDADVDAVGC